MRLAMSALYTPAFSRADIQLRPMVTQDESVFRGLYAEVRAPELSATNWSAAEKQSFCDSQYALQDKHYCQHYADFEKWTICRHGAVIGRLYLATFDGALTLMDITIAAALRGGGIGTHILQDVVAQADTQQREMRLHVEPNNSARHLYARLGFVAIGEPGIYQEMRRAPGAAM